MKCISCKSSKIEIVEDGTDNWAICMDCGESRVVQIDLRSTEQRIIDLEKQLGVRLPEALRQPLIQESTMFKEGFDVALPNNLQMDDHWDYFLGESPFSVWPIECIPGSTLLQNDFLRDEWGIPKEIVLLFGDGHIWLGLDYGINQSEPPVVYITSDPFRKIVLFQTFEKLLKAQQQH